MFFNIVILEKIWPFLVVHLDVLRCHISCVNQMPFQEQVQDCTCLPITPRTILMVISTIHSAEIPPFSFWKSLRKIHQICCCLQQWIYGYPKHTVWILSLNHIQRSFNVFFSVDETCRWQWNCTRSSSKERQFSVEVERLIQCYKQNKAHRTLSPDWRPQRHPDGELYAYS